MSTNILFLIYTPLFIAWIMLYGVCSMEMISKNCNENKILNIYTLQFVSSVMCLVVSFLDVTEHKHTSNIATIIFIFSIITTATSFKNVYNYTSLIHLDIKWYIKKMFEVF